MPSFARSRTMFRTSDTSSGSSAEVISSISRRVLLGYHGAAYAAENVVLAAAGNVDHDRIVGETCREFVCGAGVDCPQVRDDRSGQAQFLRESIDLRHRSPPFPTPLWQISTDASKILFLSD